MKGDESKSSKDKMIGKRIHKKDRDIKRSKANETSSDEEPKNVKRPKKADKLPVKDVTSDEENYDQLARRKKSKSTEYYEAETEDLKAKKKKDAKLKASSQGSIVTDNESAANHSTVKEIKQTYVNDGEQYKLDQRKKSQISKLSKSSRTEEGTNRNSGDISYHTSKNIDPSRYKESKMIASLKSRSSSPKERGTKQAAREVAKKQHVQNAVHEECSMCVKLQAKLAEEMQKLVEVCEYADTLAKELDIVNEENEARKQREERAIQALKDLEDVLEKTEAEKDICRAQTSSVAAELDNLRQKVKGLTEKQLDSDERVLSADQKIIELEARERDLMEEVKYLRSLGLGRSVSDVNMFDKDQSKTSVAGIRVSREGDEPQNRSAEFGKVGALNPPARTVEFEDERGKHRPAFPRYQLGYAATPSRHARDNASYRTDTADRGNSTPGDYANSKDQSIDEEKYINLDYARTDSDMFKTGNLTTKYCPNLHEERAVPGVDYGNTSLMRENIESYANQLYPPYKHDEPVETFGDGWHDADGLLADEQYKIPVEPSLGVLGYVDVRDIERAKLLSEKNKLEAAIAARRDYPQIPILHLEHSQRARLGSDYPSYSQDATVPKSYNQPNTRFLAAFSKTAQSLLSVFDETDAILSRRERTPEKDRNRYLEDKLRSLEMKYYQR